MAQSAALWHLFEAKADALGARVVHAADDLAATRASVSDPPRDVVCRAELAVAETGSMLVNLANPERSAAFLAERLWLVVQAENIVATLDEALVRVAALIADGSHYATLMSGPSRTADIERTLTIGVHGPRELVIVVAGAVS